MQSPSQDPDDLILEAAEGRRILSDAELRRIVEYVAAAGFDPNARERVRGRLAGMTWRGAVLRGRDRLPPAEVKFLSHVLRDRQWPDSTTLLLFLRGIRRVVLDPRSGLFTSRYGGTWQFGVVRRSSDLIGPAGHAWILIEYRVELRHWITAFQPESGLDYLDDPARTDLRWLRHPENWSEPLTR